MKIHAQKEDNKSLSQQGSQSVVSCQAQLEEMTAMAVVTGGNSKVVSILVKEQENLMKFSCTSISPHRNRRILTFSFSFFGFE